VAANRSGRPRQFLSATPSLYFNNGAYPQVYHPNREVPYLRDDAAFTMMVWAYYDTRNWPSDWVGVFGATPPPDKGQFNNGVGLAIYNGNLCLQFYGAEVRAENAINTRTWYHLAATKSPGAINENSRLYINGDRWDHVTAGSDTAPRILAAIPMLGRSGDYKVKTLPSRYFNGFLKDARIYPSSLPPSQIKSAYTTEW